MKKFLFAFLVIVIIATGFKVGKDDVFICNGSRSEVYHKTDTCKGLEKCTTDLRRLLKTKRLKSIKEEPVRCVVNK